MKRLKYIICPVAFMLTVLQIQAGACMSENCWWKGKNAIVTQPDGQLKNTLLAKSPYLSDTVLIEYSSTPTKGSKAISPGNYKQVIIANSPVTDNVKAAIDARSLPLGIRQQIDSAQVGVSVRATLENEISYFESQKTISESELKRFYLTDTAIVNGIDSVIAFLSLSSSPEAKEELTEAYLTKGDTSQAIATLNQLAAVAGYENYVAIYSLLLNSDGNAFSLLNDTSLIQQIADDTLKKGYLTARAILALLTGKTFPELIEDFPVTPTAKMAQEEENFLIEKEIYPTTLFTQQKDYIFAYPNPANNSLTFDYRISQDYNNSTIGIYNIIGEQVFNYTIFNSVGKVQMHTSILSSGVYFYALTVNNNTIAREKLIIIKQNPE